MEELRLILTENIRREEQLLALFKNIFRSSLANENEIIGSRQYLISNFVNLL